MIEGFGDAHFAKQTSLAAGLKCVYVYQQPLTIWLSLHFSIHQSELILACRTDEQNLIFNTAHPNV